jgi:hypothetical protein
MGPDTEPIIEAAKRGALRDNVDAIGAWKASSAERGTVQKPSTRVQRIQV